MNNLIEALKRQDLVWHGAAKNPITSTISSGYAELDYQLNGGIVQTGVIEILSDFAIGELRLLMPTLALNDDKLLVFISPPGHINAQMMFIQGLNLAQLLIVNPQCQQDALWAAELCLRSGACASVLLWTNESLETHQIKRLQLACEKGSSRQFIIRSQKVECIGLPFDLSLSLSACPQGLSAKINKRKRGWSSQEFIIDMRKSWPTLTLQNPANNLVYFPTQQTG